MIQGGGGICNPCLFHLKDTHTGMHMKKDISPTQPNPPDRKDNVPTAIAVIHRRDCRV